MAERKGTMVNGFLFDREEEAQQAQKEIEGIRFIEERTDKNRPQAVLEVYNQMVQQDLFETAVGFTYLKELQEYLIQNPVVDNGDILPIRVRHPVLEKSIRRAAAPQKKKEVTPNARPADKYQKRYQVTLFLSVVLSISIVGMFLISASSNSRTILNYENQVLNEYAQWKEELDERQEALNERERLLQEREADAAGK